VTKIQIDYCSPGALQPNPWNSNRVGPDMEARLEASIREFGFIKPIVCREIEGGVLQIIGGEHRARKAVEMGIESIPVVILQGVSDQRAMALGLADNGRYGEDDALKLASILGEMDAQMLELLPFDESDLAGIFASSAVNLDDLGFDDTDPDVGPLPDADAPRATVTHELMRFKVPVEDRDRLEKFIQYVIKSKGFAAEQDSMVAAGMALVEMANAAREVM
jgi:ParB-like chromosome segregation protein Spo0J